MYRFNRFYLLFSIAFSFTAPLISFEIESQFIPAQAHNYFVPPLENTIAESQEGVIVQQKPILINILLLLYCTITACLGFKFVANLCRICLKAAKNKTVWHQGKNLVLVKEPIPAHSFFNTIFLSESDFNNIEIEQEIITHEFAHIEQKHSLDIIIIELLLVFFWFNHFLLYFRRAIQLNHEFLADDVVIQKHKDVYAYQLLILDKSSQNSCIHLASLFTFSPIKKRLQMMTKKENNWSTSLKKVALLPLFLCLVYIMSQSVSAQTIKQNTNTKQNESLQGVNATKGVSQELIHEWEAAIEKATTTKTSKSGRVYTMINVGKLDLERMEYIYNAMSDTQRANVTQVDLIPTPPPPAQKSPTKVQLQAWENASLYGVWLDGKRIDNEALQEYKPADFALFYVSKLMKNATNYGKHYYQVSLLTPEYYEAAYISKSK